MLGLRGSQHRTIIEVCMSVCFTLKGPNFEISFVNQLPLFSLSGSIAMATVCQSKLTLVLTCDILLSIGTKRICVLQPP